MMFFLRPLVRIVAVVVCIVVVTQFVKGSSSLTKPILVMDLDQTMIYSVPERDGRFTVHFRPHLLWFLERASYLFSEVVLFTAATKSYADAIVDHILAMLPPSDSNANLFVKRFYRPSCTVSPRGGVVKDLTLVSLDMSKVILVDDTPSTFSLQPRNGVRIKRWFGEEDDVALVHCMKRVLEPACLRNDVRNVVA